MRRFIKLTAPFVDRVYMCPGTLLNVLFLLSFVGGVITLMRGFGPRGTYDEFRPVATILQGGTLLLIGTFPYLPFFSKGASIVIRVPCHTTLLVVLLPTILALPIVSAWYWRRRIRKWAATHCFEILECHELPITDRLFGAGGRKLYMMKLLTIEGKEARVHVTFGSALGLAPGRVEVCWN